MRNVKSVNMFHRFNGGRQCLSLTMNSSLRVRESSGEYGIERRRQVKHSEQRDHNLTSEMSKCNWAVLNSSEPSLKFAVTNLN